MTPQIEEQNGLIIDTSGVDPFCLSTGRQLSITRDVAERLVFAQMSSITAENVAEYYARLNVLNDVYPTTSVLLGRIFNDAGDEIADRELKVLDFISRIGITTNLKHDTLRNFLDRIAAHLVQLKEHNIKASDYTYDDLYARYERGVEYFFQVSDLNHLGRVNDVISVPGVRDAIDECAMGATIEEFKKQYLGEE